MFYCDICAKRNEWPRGWPHPQSIGPCEVCGRKAICTDIPSRVLPEAQRKSGSHD